MAGVQVTLEDDATPLVRILGATVRRAAASKAGPTVAGMKGVMAVKSTVDPQAATIRFDKGHVHVERGVASDVDVLIEADLNNMVGPDAPKPKVSGAAKHVKFALGVAKVMEPPHGTWQQEATAFFEFARQDKDAPKSMRVVNTDNRTEIHLGDPGQPEYEIHGPEARLLAIFTGGSVIGEDVLSGKIRVRGSLAHASILTGRSIAWMMGEGQ